MEQVAKRARRAVAEGLMRRWTKLERKTTTTTTIDLVGSSGTAAAAATSTVVRASTRLSSFHVLSWNLLARSLLEGEEHAAHYAECDPRFLEWEHRKRVILGVLVGASTEEEEDGCGGKVDIACIQELDEECYLHEFKEALGRVGFESVFKRRTSESTFDGVAIFWRTRMFDVIETGTLECRVPGDRLLDRDNVMAWALLVPKGSNKKLLVSTTHLLFNQNRGDVKLAQLLRIGHELNKVRNRHADSETIKPSVIFCGDFNLAPFSPLRLWIMQANGAKTLNDIEPLSTSARHDRRDISGQNMVQMKRGGWYCNPSGHFGSGTCLFARYQVERNETSEGRSTKGVIPTEICEDHTSCEFPLGRLQSVYSIDAEKRALQGSTGEPIITMIHSTFRGTVDYMFFSEGDDNLRCISRLEMPHFNTTARAIAGMPMEHWPSDHFSLQARFVL